MPTSDFSQSDYLIQIVININSHTDTIPKKPTDLILIYTVCKGRAYLGSAGLGLRVFKYDITAKSRFIEKSLYELSAIYN